MNHKSWWVVFLLSAGVVVLVVSLYRAAVLGAMNKAGFVYSNTNYFDNNEVAREVANDSWWRCRHRLDFVDSIRYSFARGELKEKLGFELGENRIKCGMEMILKKDASFGAYKILKGARYWEESMKRDESKPRLCHELPSEDYVVRLGRVVELARGSAKVEIGKVKESLYTTYLFEQERCIAQ